MSIRPCLVAAILLLPVALAAQTAASGGEGTTWQEVWQELTSTDDLDDDGEEAWADAYSLLEELAAHPIDFNRATRAQLEQLPFLGEQQVADLLDYRLRYGSMRSAGELRMVRSLDFQQLQLLPFFIVFGPAPTDRSDTLKTAVHHDLSAAVRVPFYRREGDRNGYLGHPYRHELRYEVSAGRHLRLGLLGAQDAGEPFLAGRNRWGYDYYTFFAQLRHLGVLDHLILGRFKFTAGKGLVIGGGSFTSKTAIMQSMGRTPGVLRPHFSRSEDGYLQGAAATLKPAPGLSLSAFASLRCHDATLADDGSVTTLISSGYHRTQGEMDKKHNTRATDVGARVQWGQGGVSLGATALYTRLNRPLQPGDDVLYRRYWPRGRQFVNASADYRWRVWRLVVEGETAIDAHGHIATQNTLSLQPADSWRLMALQRFYSYRYESLHARALSEGGRVQNESGLLLGATCHPHRHWQLQAYFDYAYFPWARYLVSQSSASTDVQLAATWQKGSVTLTTRYRHHQRQRDNETKSALTRLTDHRLHLTLQWKPRKSPWRLVSRAAFGRTTRQEASTGCALSQTATWQGRRLLLSALAAWFRTDDYASRLYLHEQRLPYEYGFSPCSGHGLRLTAMARATMGRWQLHARLGLTRYLDRTTIGTGLQQTDHRGLVDLDVQLRYHL